MLNSISMHIIQLKTIAKNTMIPHLIITGDHGSGKKFSKFFISKKIQC